LYEKRHGKGKEYIGNKNNNKLLFEGEYYFNYRKNGKKYNQGILEYEGDFLFNEKFNGKGFDKEGNIIYEIINGNGLVKEYDKKGRLIFDGEYLNCKIWNGKKYIYNFGGRVISELNYVQGKKTQK